MISKQIQNMGVLKESPDEEMLEQMPTNLSLDKTVQCGDSGPPIKTMDPMDAAVLLVVDVPQEESAKRPSEKPAQPLASETKIQLSFSVDRLLSADRTTSESSEAPPEQCCDSGYSCCMYPSCLVGSQHEIHQPHQQRHHLHLKSAGAYQACNPHADSFNKIFHNALMTNSYMDFKAVVRPTPIRALGTNCDTVPLCAPFPAFGGTSLLRFHHQPKQTSPAPQHPALATMSPMMTSLAGLKSLQLNQQHATHPPGGALHHRYPAKSHNLMDTAAAAATAGLAGHHHPHHHPHHTLLQHHHHHQQQQHQQQQQQFSMANTTVMNNSNTTNNSQNISGGSSGGGGGSSSTNNGAVNSGGGNGKRKRSWSRAVFSNLQRKGLEIQFQQQKYITKPDRRKLAARLNLTDAQVKVWFQNRRMKWRHTRENLKSGQEKQVGAAGGASAAAAAAEADVDADADAGQAPEKEQEKLLVLEHDERREMGYSSDGSSSVGDMSDNEDDDDEIDVVE